MGKNHPTKPHDDEAASFEDAIATDGNDSVLDSDEAWASGAGDSDEACATVGDDSHQAHTVDQLATTMPTGESAITKTSTDEPISTTLPTETTTSDRGGGIGTATVSGTSSTDNASPHRALNLRSALSVFLVTAASGLLFHASATTASQSGAATDGDLVNLVRHRQAVVAELEAERDAIANQVAEHSDTDLAAPLTSASASNFNRSAISGPGVVITLTDAPAGDIPEGATPNDMVIHQQDIEDVMNALWDGGAEAMTVQGVRVSSRTVIRCIGNVILVDGASYSPPYEIAAIGDISALVTAVETNPRVVNYMQYVALYKMGWKLEKKEVMHMPAASTDATVSYAKVVE